MESITTDKNFGMNVFAKLGNTSLNWKTVFRKKTLDKINKLKALYKKLK